MLRLPPVQSDAERIKILQGLLQLRKDGHFHAIWATDNSLLIQHEPHGRRCFLSWRRAKAMVATAQEAAAAPEIAKDGTRRKPPAAEGPQRAETALTGLRSSPTGRRRSQPGAERRST
jgi:hypothetical protein